MNLTVYFQGPTSKLGFNHGYGAPNLFYLPVKETAGT